MPEMKNLRASVDGKEILRGAETRKPIGISLKGSVGR